MNTTSKIWRKLEDPEYRKAFVASQIDIGIPFQVRSLVKSRGWTQAQLAEKTGMRQPSISGLMTPGKARPNIETLRRLAEAFDCGLTIRFAPFSDLVEWSDRFDPESFSVPSFADERHARSVDTPGANDTSVIESVDGSIRAFVSPDMCWQNGYGAIRRETSPSSSMNIVCINSSPKFQSISDHNEAESFVSSSSLIQLKD